MKRPIKKILKIFGWTLLSLLLLIIIAICVALWYLSPSRLTPIVEDLANDNLNAHVTIERAELTFWKTFPNLKISIDGVQIRSKALDGLPEDLQATLPANADSLLSLGHFEGSVDVFSLISGKFDLNDVIIDRPSVNLLQVNDTVANFNIVPPTPPDTTKSVIPEITISKFAITNALPITYRSLPDSVDIALKLNTIELNGDVAPKYTLTIDTGIDSPALADFSYEEIQFSLNGGIGWSGRNPYQLKLNGIDIKFAELDALLSTAVDFENNLRFESLDFQLKNLPVAKLVTHLPASLAEQFETLETNMLVNASVNLTKPYILADSITVPWMDMKFSIPDCFVKYDNLDFYSFTTDIKASINGDDLDRSTLDIERFVIDGKAIDVNLSATLSDLVSDPRLKGHFSGSVDFAQLPRKFIKAIAQRLDGTMTADAGFALRKSNLSKNGFHNMYLLGEVDLDNFKFITADSTTSTYAHRTKLTFGTSDRLVQNGHAVDSILMVQIDSDTASFLTDGVDARFRGLKASFGTTNVSALTDTTVVTPFGGSVNIDRLSYFSIEDSVRLRLSGVSGIAMLRRFEDNAKLPKLGLKFNVDRIGMLQKDMAVMVSNSHLDLQANLKPRGKRPARNAALDSISNRRRIRLAADSARVPGARYDREGHRLYTASEIDSLGGQTIDFNVDNSLRSLLFRWNVKAQLKADRGRVRFSSLRLPNTFSNLNMTLNTDSVALNSLNYKLGHSDFALNGVISNLRRALLSKYPQPLRIDFNLVSDTININQVVRALAKPTMDKVSDVEDDADLWAEQQLDNLEHNELGDSVIAAVLVPLNIDAGFTINAANVIYSDFLLKDLRGQLLVYQGVVNLHDLSASTELGYIDLSALYSAPTKDDMSFGLGMNLKDFHVERLPSVVPALDSIMPIFKSLSGTVNAQLAVTTDLTPDMYFDMPTMKAAMKFEGDSLVVFDNKTFKKLAKWLLFKHKDRNMIDHLSVEVTIEDGILNVYPFLLDIDRYKLGVMGYNNLNLDLHYHISVLKSPIPFKFGINIKGRPDHMKIRFGGAKFKDGMVAEKSAIASDTRINLLKEMNNVFRRGLKAAKLGPLNIAEHADTTYMSAPDVITATDSVAMIRAGIIQPTDSINFGFADSDTIPILTADPDSLPSIFVAPDTIRH